MPVISNNFIPPQPNRELTDNVSEKSQISGARGSDLRFVDTPSTRHVKDFSALSALNIKANVLLNSDDHSVPIHMKDPSALIDAIDNNISQMAKEWGVSIQDVEAMTGRDKGIIEPACGVTANIIMKLFLDNDNFSYSFENGQSLSLSQLQEQLTSLPSDKDFILRVTDGALGHAYVIDLPASPSPCREVFLYQSDLGDGVTRTLRFEDWMNQKGSRPISLDDINAHFTSVKQNHMDLAHIAKLFDVDGDVNMMRAEHLISHKQGEFNFQLFEYDLKNLENNMSIIKSHCH